MIRVHDRPSNFKWHNAQEMAPMTNKFDDAHEAKTVKSEQCWAFSPSAGRVTFQRRRTEVRLWRVRVHATFSQQPNVQTVQVMRTSAQVTMIHRHNTFKNKPLKQHFHKKYFVMTSRNRIVKQ